MMTQYFYHGIQMEEIESKARPLHILFQINIDNELVTSLTYRTTELLVTLSFHN